mmetsp:Transcript_3366/g.5775  ORF Transcript_3366/g.5775 Transcript_3366/m.5775 type:complete len:231 (-) Transcript_3366:206-898(-)
MIQSYIPHPEKAPIDSDPVAKEQKPAPRHHPDLCRAVGDTKVVQIVFVEGGLVVVEDGVPRPEQRPVNAALAGRRPPLPRGVRRGAGEGLLLLLLLLRGRPGASAFQRALPPAMVLLRRRERALGGGEHGPLLLLRGRLLLLVLFVMVAMPPFLVLLCILRHPGLALLLLLPAHTGTALLGRLLLARQQSYLFAPAIEFLLQRALVRRRLIIPSAPIVVASKYGYHHTHG